MKTATVDYLPVWKRGATAEERLLELAMIARNKPERFKRMIVVYQEDVAPAPGQKRPATITRYIGGEEQNTTETVGLLELGKLELLRYSHEF